MIDHHLFRLDTVIGLDLDLLYGPVGGRVNRIFHLHGLQHDDLVVFLHLIADLDQNFQDLPRHRGFHLYTHSLYLRNMMNLRS